MILLCPSRSAHHCPPCDVASRRGTRACASNRARFQTDTITEPPRRSVAPASGSCCCTDARADQHRIESELHANLGDLAHRLARSDSEPDTLVARRPTRPSGGADSSCRHLRAATARARLEAIRARRRNRRVRRRLASAPDRSRPRRRDWRGSSQRFARRATSSARQRNIVRHVQIGQHLFRDALEHRRGHRSAFVRTRPANPAAPEW